MDGLVAAVGTGYFKNNIIPSFVFDGIDLVFEKNVGTDFLAVVERVPDVENKLMRILNSFRNELLCLLVFAYSENDCSAECICKGGISLPDTGRNSAVCRLDFDVDAFFSGNDFRYINQGSLLYLILEQLCDNRKSIT